MAQKSARPRRPLRRAQTFLRTLGIDITFSREGRPGSRVIRMRTSAENTVSTVSIVGAARSNGSQAIIRPWVENENIACRRC